MGRPGPPAKFAPAQQDAPTPDLRTCYVVIHNLDRALRWSRSNVNGLVNGKKNQQPKLAWAKYRSS